MVAAPNTATYLPMQQTIIIDSVAAKQQPLMFNVRAQNSIGYDDLEWSVYVTPAYKIDLENATLPIRLIAPATLSINGCVSALQNAILPNLVAVVIRLECLKNIFQLFCIYY